MATGAEAIVWSLEALGAKDVFGIPGGNVMPLYDALMDKSSVRHILTRHEQGAGHAAEGYSLASGRVGVAIATSGPGATNLVTPIADAYMDSVPLLVITGQVFSTLRGTDAFQEADLIGMTLGISKHSIRVTTPGEIPSALSLAHVIATTGRPGPVLVEITKDAQQTSSTFAWPRNVDSLGYSPPPPVSRKQLGAVIQLLRESSRPVLLIGSGVRSANASDALRAFAELANIPVITSVKGRDVLPARHHLNRGVPQRSSPAAEALRDADTVIAIGVNLRGRVGTEELQLPVSARLVHIDVDAAELGKLVNVQVPVVGDAGEVLRSLLDLWPKHAAQGIEMHNDPNVEAPSTKKLPAPRDLKRITSSEALRRIGELTGSGGVYAVGQDSLRLSAIDELPHDRPSSFLTSSRAGTPGFPIPAAMGAKIADQSRVVWAIEDFDGFQTMNQELATCTVNQIAIKVAVFRNSNGPVLPDVVDIGAAYGAATFRVDVRSQLDDAIGQALAVDGRPALIEFVVARD